MSGFSFPFLPGLFMSPSHPYPHRLCLSTDQCNWMSVQCSLRDQPLERQTNAEKEEGDKAESHKMLQIPVEHEPINSASW